MAPSVSDRGHAFSRLARSAARFAGAAPKADASPPFGASPVADSGVRCPWICDAETWERFRFQCARGLDHQKAVRWREADGDEAERASFVSAMDSCSEAGRGPDFGGAAAFVTSVRRGLRRRRRSGRRGRPRRARALPPRARAQRDPPAPPGGARCRRWRSRAAKRRARRGAVRGGRARAARRTRPAPPALGALLARQVRSELVVDSPSAPGYAAFASNEGAGGQVVWYELRMFDIANADDVLHGGAPPKLVERGPYAYREYYRLLDVEFLDGGDAVSYCTWTYYVFDADRSAPGVAEDDEVVQADLVLFGLAEALRPLPTLVDAALRALLDAHPEDWALAAAVLALQRWSGARAWELLLRLLACAEPAAWAPSGVPPPSA